MEIIFYKRKKLFNYYSLSNNSIYAIWDSFCFDFYKLIKKLDCINCGLGKAINRFCTIPRGVSMVSVCPKYTLSDCEPTIINNFNNLQLLRKEREKSGNNIL